MHETQKYIYGLQFEKNQDVSAIFSVQQKLAPFYNEETEQRLSQVLADQ